MSSSPTSLNQVIESPEASKVSFDLSQDGGYLDRDKRKGNETTLTASPEPGFEYLASSASAPDISELVTTQPTRPHQPHRESTTSFPQVIPSTHESRTLVLCFDGTGDQFDQDVWRKKDRSWRRFFAINLGGPRVIKNQKRNGVNVHRTVKIRMEAKTDNDGKPFSYSPRAHLKLTWVKWLGGSEEAAIMT
ncbi:hypothetical protein RSOLAG22IIIB_09587 [Rhizoctonia solani]|uniref:DUF2235 domain-containing protein n=1 Tax=Rhizoctonia solani TaxID=456999 RepID=A0A0K6FZB7_9AGAM|nr:hypothetical protein RSOLAG22IIIB_09587 [Rhizoctonia solani]